MRLIVLADVHGNLEALDAVLADAAQELPGARLVVAGDIVGYGPDPEACLWRLVDHGALMVRGNHEEMVLGWRGFSRCVHAGITAAAWTRQIISEEARRCLASLPRSLAISTVAAVCHGDLEDADTYVSDAARARRALAQLSRGFPGAQILFCGHTHHAAVFSMEGAGLVSAPEGRLALPRGLCLLNPGAVGQARDGAVVARYLQVDTEAGEVCFRAVPYAHHLTTQKQRRLGLVPAVELRQPQGVRRYVERLRTRWARARLG